jgi:acyl carrier protein
VTETEVRARLASWIAGKSGQVSAEEISGDTPILERRLLTSLQIVDLILAIEELSGRRIEVSKLKPGVFRDIDTIYRAFFAPGVGA